MQPQYSLGFVSQSHTAGEMRVPIWWEHLTHSDWPHPRLHTLIFEKNFGISAFHAAADTHLLNLGFQVSDRASVLNHSDIVISLKPQSEWLDMSPGSTLVGWFNHLSEAPSRAARVNCVDFENIKIEVDNRAQKLLYRNAQVAGEAGVAQTLETLRQIAPNSPAVSAQQKLAVVLGYGNLGHGAVTELIRQDIDRIIVFSQRHPGGIENQFAEVEYRQMLDSTDHIYTYAAERLSLTPIIETLRQADIIVNATLPSSTHPHWTFIRPEEFSLLKPNMAYIDPVHKAGHGADFAQVTSPSQPLKQINRGDRAIWYNGCNAMPSYRSAHASFIISQSIINHLDDILNAVESSEMEAVL